jgi:hypothetical protein
MGKLRILCLPAIYKNILRCIIISLLEIMTIQFYSVMLAGNVAEFFSFVKP